MPNYFGISFELNNNCKFSVVNLAKLHDREHFEPFQVMLKIRLDDILPQEMIAINPLVSI